MYPCAVKDTLLAFAFQCWSLTELSTCSLNSPELIKASLWGGAGFVLNSNICRKVRSVPSLPLLKGQDFVSGFGEWGCWHQAGEEGGGYVHLTQALLWSCCLALILTPSSCSLLAAGLRSTIYSILVCSHWRLSLQKEGMFSFFQDVLLSLKF